MRYQAIDPQLFITNRRRLRERLEPGQTVVLRARRLAAGRIDEDQNYRQDSNFFWAVGISQPDCVAVLTNETETLYIRAAKPLERVWMGDRLSVEEARTISGIQDVQSLSHYRKPQGQVEFDGLIAELRSVKQPIEIELIKRSIATTTQGLADVVAEIAPGKLEYELEAKLIGQYIKSAAQHAFSPVIASGANTCIMHYIDNSRPLGAGELVLVDTGAEYARYAADISRTYPTSGKYSIRQRELYEAVLRVQRGAIKLLKPGVMPRDYELQVAELMLDELKGLGIIKDTHLEQDKDGFPKWRQFWPHRTSHFLGLDVHDAGNYAQPLQANMVLTVEPGIYIPEEGIGVRLEDDILITKEGAVNLSADVPIEPDEIEKLLRNKA